MSMRMPMASVLGLGTAKDGTGDWWGQRVSAVALILLGLWFAVSIANLDNLEHASAVGFIAMPLNTVLLSLFCVTLAYHSCLGVQVVVEDYVHESWIKVTSLMASRFAHVFVAIVSVYAILKIGLGA